MLKTQLLRKTTLLLLYTVGKDLLCFLHCCFLMCTEDKEEEGKREMNKTSVLAQTKISYILLWFKNTYI